MENNSFKVCFEHLKTEDLEEYIQLAKEELEARKKEAFTKASDKLIDSIKEFCKSCPQAKLYVNNEETMIVFFAENIDSIYFEVDPDKNELRIDQEWD